MSTKRSAPEPELPATVRLFFVGKGLSWTTAIESGLAEFDVKCVEHLKLLTDDEWDGLFIGSSIIVQRLAKKVFAALKESGDVDPNKCANELGINDAAAAVTPPPSKLGSSASKTAHKFKNNGDHKSMSSYFKVTKSVTSDEAKRQRLARKADREAEILALAGVNVGHERSAATDVEHFAAAGGEAGDAAGGATR